jgi:hypothetical protein
VSRLADAYQKTLFGGSPELVRPENSLSKRNLMVQLAAQKSRRVDTVGTVVLSFDATALPTKMRSSNSLSRRCWEYHQTEG